MQSRKLAQRATGALLALGLAFGLCNVANAATATYYPVSSGTIENGYFRGRYSVQANYSYITLSTSSNKSTTCVAKQDGHAQPATDTGTNGMGCTAAQSGTMLTVGDYASYLVS